MNSRQEPTILIAYPKEFLCYEKFERKLTKILSKLNHFSLAYINDYNGFIKKKLSLDDRLDEELVEYTEGYFEKITHAVVFNDGNSFSNIIEKLKEKGVSSRLINTDITKVINVNKDKEYDVYIGRGSDWGNPYAIGVDGDREEVIRKYQYDFDRGFLKSSKDDLLKLKGKTLGCHCKPKACHGEILANYLNSYDDGK